MAFTSWRGVVGCIKPTLRPGGLEELIRMLPEGIGVLPLFLNISKGTTDEFKRAVAPYEPLLEQLAEAGCDLIHPEGAPPFMLLGYKGEAELLKKWERQHKIPMFTSGSNHVRALRALKAKKIVGATYFTGKINDVFAKYFDRGRLRRARHGGPRRRVRRRRAAFVASGLCVREAGVPQAPQGRRDLSARLRLARARVIDTLEQDLGVPVVHPIPARCWEIQLRLSIRQPVKGYGRLLAEMTPG